MIEKKFIKQHLNKSLLTLSAVIIAWLLLVNFHCNIYLRLAICLAIVVICFSIPFLIKMINERKGNALSNSIHTQHESITTRQVEAALLKEKMDEAVKLLKTSGRSMQYRGKAALYVLPWFLVMGPSAVGKSTLLRHSGLSFPLEQESEIRIKGFGGTRNCDWWFSDEAVLLDTAGRYTTEVDDHDEWITFLKLLKKHRRQQPINGVIIALTADELILCDELKLQSHVHIIRKRLDEVAEVLGFVCPAYLVLTKCDLITGFLPFFSNLNQESRTYACGMSELNSKSIHHFLDYLFNQRIPIMTAKRDLKSKIQIFHFPEELQIVFQKIEKMLSLFEKENTYHHIPWMKGLYLTSAEQHSKDNASEGYFIKGFFKTLFSMKSLARFSGKNRFDQWVMKGFAGLFFTLILGIGWIGFSHAFMKNSDLINRDKSYAYEVSTQLALSSTNSIQQINDLMPLVTEYDLNKNHNGGLNLLSRLGLFQGLEINRSTGILIARILQEHFIPNVIGQIKKSLMSYSNHWEGWNDQQKDRNYMRYYLALKAYLLLCFPEHIHAQQDAFLYLNFISKQFSNDEEYDLKLMAIYLSVLNHHAETAFNIYPAMVDKDMIEKSRKQLQRYISPQTILDRIDYDVYHHAYLTLDDLFPNQELCFSQRALPKIYMADAWHHVVKKQINHELNDLHRRDWVLDDYSHVVLSASDKKQLQQKTYDQYYVNYRQAWIQFIRGISIRPFQSVEKANDKLKRLYLPANVFVQIISMVSRNLSILPNNVFQLARPDQEKYLQSIKKVRDQFQMLSLSSQNQRAFLDFSRQVFTKKDTCLNRAVDQVVTLTNKIPDAAIRSAILHLMESPFRETWRIVLLNAVHALQQKWQSTLFPKYRLMIAGKFPFHHAKQIISLSDFVTFFHPQTGYLWNFINKNFNPLIVFKDTKWQANRWLDVAFPFSKTFLIQLNYAQLIKESFFSNHKNDPSLEFEISPIPHPQLSQIRLKINNREMRYQNGPRSWYFFNWNGQIHAQRASLVLHAKDDRIIASKTYYGQWSIFRLMSQANSHFLNNHLTRLNWTIYYSSRKNITIQMLLRCNGPNIFDLIYKQHFSLPMVISG